MIFFNVQPINISSHNIKFNYTVLSSKEFGNICYFLNAIVTETEF